MASATLTTDSHAATYHALRTATATTLCLLVGECCQVEHTDLAVWTTYMVMVQYTFSSFQKGVERVIGRGLGILAGLVVSTCLEGTPLIGQAVMALLLTACFYVYFSGRLAYTFLNAGLYAVLLFEIGNANPSSAVAEGEAMFAAVVLGVVVANVVIFLAGAERDLHIEVGETPLWPLRIDWLNQSLMLTVTVHVTVKLADWLGLPIVTSAISVMVLTIAPNIQSLIQKGELRVAGALMATAWALGTFILVGFQSHLALLALLLFMGQLLAAYVTRVGGTYSYAGLQMGLVLPMLVVAPPSDFGSLTGAVQRLQGILIALVTSVLIGGLWPRFPVTGNTTRK